MRASPNSTCLGSDCGGRNLLNRPEGADIRRLTTLVGRIFGVPVAYAAMLGHRDEVMSRIGTGPEYGQYLRTFPLTRLLEAPVVIRDAREGLPLGSDFGDIRFFASAPIGTLCGQDLGVLVIADLIPRPAFSRSDLDTLADLASVLAGQLEMRMIASQCVDSRMRNEEAEDRFHWAATLSSTLMACSEDDGACSFVNQTWLAFSGRTLPQELRDGWQSLLHPDHAEAFLTHYWDAFHARQPFALTVPLRRYDGDFRWMRAAATPRLLKDGTFTGFALSFTDLSSHSDAPAQSCPEALHSEAPHSEAHAPQPTEVSGRK